MNNSLHTKSIIQLTDLCYCYPGADVNTIDHLDLSLENHERVGIVAPNGSGKTTLFHLIMGLLKPSSGSIQIFDKSLSTDKDFEAVRRKIGLLFQDSDDQLFSPTVLEDVAFGPLNLGKSPDEARAIAETLLKQLGLEGFEDRITYKLSGGEKRLVALATILAMEPEVLLLDEPSNALDKVTKQMLKDHLQALDLPCLIISHDPDFLVDLTKTNYTMENGKLTEMGEMHIHYHAHPHTHHHH